MTRTQPGCDQTARTASETAQEMVKRAASSSLKLLACCSFDSLGKNRHSCDCQGLCGLILVSGAR